MPKRTKYRRPHRVSYEGRTKGGDKVSFGEFGLVATEGAWITSRQIEAARIAINRYFPDLAHQTILLHIPLWHRQSQRHD